MDAAFASETKNIPDRVFPISLHKCCFWSLSTAESESISPAKRRLHFWKNMISLVLLMVQRVINSRQRNSHAAWRGPSWQVREVGLRELRHEPQATTDGVQTKRVRRDSRMSDCGHYPLQETRIGIQHAPNSYFFTIGQNRSHNRFHTWRSEFCMQSST